MVTKSVFGQCPQGTVYAYKLENTSGVSVTVLTLGGIIQSICVPTKEGVKDVCLGYHTVEEYLAGTAYFGAIVGRNANRIAGAQFPLNDEIIHVLANNGPNQLHGGPVGLETIAASIGEDANTIEDVYEPYLMQIGFLTRTMRGRMVTRLGYEHFGFEFTE